MSQFRFVSLMRDSLIFVFFCSRIGHGHKDCEEWQGDNQEKTEMDNLPYGQWLRASNTGGRWDRCE